MIDLGLIIIKWHQIRHPNIGIQKQEVRFPYFFGYWFQYLDFAPMTIA